jgi:hypothetical protein
VVGVMATVPLEGQMVVGVMATVTISSGLDPSRNSHGGQYTEHDLTL